MREILFKAKRTDDGEWVEGFYVNYRNSIHYIIIRVEGIFVWREVEPTTLCQYTGLTDLNGNKIWENDIIRYCDEVYMVSWDAGDARFRLEDKTYIESFHNINARWVDIIGNIFDNPELTERLF